VDIRLPEAVNVTNDTTNDTTNGGSARKLEGRSPRRRGPKVESRLASNCSSEDIFPPFIDPAKELRGLMI